MKLERGINLGGYLSQCVHSTEHYDAFIQEEDIRKIASMGFDHVRLAIDYEVLEDEYGRTREEGFAYVTRVVEWCKRQELNIVLDLHKAYGYDFNNAGDQKKNILFTNKMVQKRFVNLWIKIAEHYANETHVAFELLNEVVEQENAEAWNLLIAETVDAIRRIARDTIIIYGGIQWNSVKTLKLLEKPKDENILFTFHFYEPLLFTHHQPDRRYLLSGSNGLLSYKVAAHRISGRSSLQGTVTDYGNRIYHGNGNGSGYCCEKCRSDFVLWRIRCY